jgi:hypothetical protein
MANKVYGLTLADITNNTTTKGLVSGADLAGIGGGTGSGNYADRTIIWTGLANYAVAASGDLIDGDVVYVTLQNGTVYMGFIVQNVLIPMIMPLTNTDQINFLFKSTFLGTTSVTLRNKSNAETSTTDQPFVELARYRA